MKLVFLLLGILTVCYSIPILAPYRSLDISSAHQDPIISSLLEFGAKELIHRGLQDNKLSHSDFRLAKVNSIHMQALNGLNYKFDVNLQDKHGLLVNSAFTMNYQPKTEEKSLSSMSYSVQKVHPVSKLSHFQTLDRSEINHNRHLKDLLEFGVHDLIQKGIHENKIPLREFKVENLLQVQKHELGLGSGTHYRFNVELNDDKDTGIMATLTLFHNPFTNEKEIIDSSYQVHPFASYLQVNAEQSSNDYFDVDVSTVSSNSEIQGALEYGVSQVINSGVADKKISLAQYTVKTINSVQKQTTGSGVNYKFSVALTDGASTSISASFTVYIKTSDQTKSVTSYNYQVQTTTTTTTTQVIEADPSAWVAVSAATISSDSDIQTCLAYGNAEVLRQALAEAKIDSTSYTVSNISSVEKQTVKNYVFYRFTVELKDAKATSTLTTVYTIIYNLSTKKPGMKSFLYKVVTKSTTTVTTVTDADGYTQIDLLDVQLTTQIKTCLEYGIAQIIQKGLAEQKMPVSTYTLLTVNSASKLAVGQITYYKFDCDLTNSAGTTVRATFTIVYNPKLTQTISMSTYNYNVKTVTSTTSTVEADETAYVDATSSATTNTQISGSLDFCSTEILKAAVSQGKLTATAGFKITKITKVQKQTVGTFLFTKIEMDLGDSITTTVNINAVVVMNTQTGERQLRTYVYSVRVVKSTKPKTPDDTEFTAVPDAEVSSLEIQNVLAFGIDQILAGALKDGKIKDITGFGVVSATARRATVTGGITFYKFILTISNDKDTAVDGTCTVMHESSGKDSIRAYTYNAKITTTVKTVITDPADDDYTSIDVATISTNADVQSGLQFSVTQVLKDALEENKIRTTEGFALEKVTSVGTAVVKKLTFYKFVIVVDNDEDTTITATLVIYYDTKTSSFILRKLNYSVQLIQNVATTIAEPADSEYTDVDESEIEISDTIKTILGVGTQQILQVALTEGKIKDTNFVVTSVNSVSRAVTKVFTFYRYSISLSNNDDTTITATFTIVHNSRSGENSLRKYNYSVKVTIWTVSNVEEPSDDEYVDFEQSQLETSEQVKISYNYGIDQVLSDGISQGKIQNKNFVVTSVSVSAKATVKQFIFYKFSYVLDNDDDTVIEVSCIVAYDTKTGEAGMRKFSYNVTITQTLINDVQEPAETDYTDIDSGLVESDDLVKRVFSTGVQGILDKALEEGKITTTNFQIKSVTQSQKVTVKKFTFYRFTVSLENDDDDNVVITSSFTVVYSSKTDEVSLRRYVYSVVITQTLINDVSEPADEDYQQVDVSEIESVDLNKAIFTYGVTELISKAVEEGKITTTDFTVTSVSSFLRATVKKYTFNRFSFILDDGDETTIQCTITVVHSSKNDENSLRRYNYQVTVVHVYVSNAEEPGDDQYGEVSLDEVQSNEVVSGGLKFAATKIVTQALTEGKITSTSFSVQSITSVYRAVVKRFTFYRYTFVLSNGDDTTIQVTATVVHDSKSNEYDVRKYTYNVTVTITLITEVREPDDDQYQDLDVTVVETDSSVQEAFQYGAKEIIAKAISEGKTTSTSFSVKTVTTVKTVTVKGFTFYRFTFTLDDGDETSMECTITVIYHSKSGEYCLRRYVYNVTITLTQINDVQEPGDDEYVDVATGEWESEDIQKALTYGSGELIKKGVEDGKVSEGSGLTLKTIVSIKRAVVKKYVFYRCEIVLENGSGAVMTATVTIIQNNKNGECALRRYVYQITITTVTTTTTTTEAESTTSTSSHTIIKYTQLDITEVRTNTYYISIIDSAIKQICNRLYKDGIIKDTSFTIVTIVSAYQKFEGVYYYRFTVTIINKWGLTLEITFVCTYTTSTTTVTVVSFSIIGSSQEFGSQICVDSPDLTKSLVIGNLETVDIKEVEGCSEIRDAMLFGVNLVGSQVAQTEKIDDADFSVSKVNSVYRQFMAGVNYRFNVDLENTSGEKVKATYTVSADHQLAMFYYVAYE